MATPWHDRLTLVGKRIEPIGVAEGFIATLSPVPESPYVALLAFGLFASEWLGSATAGAATLNRGHKGSSGARCVGDLKAPLTWRGVAELI